VEITSEQVDVGKLEQEERARVWQPESPTEWRWGRSTLRVALQN
jgi:hypothetical protein